MPHALADSAWVASTADGPTLEAEEQQLNRKLWLAAIKLPMYSVGIAPILVRGMLHVLSPSEWEHREGLRSLRGSAAAMLA